VARITWIGTIACLGGYALLIPRYKLWGAVTATAIGFSTIFVVALWKSEKLRPFRYEYTRWLKIALAEAVVIGAFEILRPTGFWLQMAAGIAAAVIFPLILILLRFPDEQERQLVKSNWAVLMARFGSTARPAAV
jgi:O-antigen/teichoic acid export membrane protein